jgi:hypothetical protein
VRRGRQRRQDGGREIGGRAGSQARTPVDAGWYWDTVITGSGGRVTKASTVRMLVRLYAKLW